MMAATVIPLLPRLVSSAVDIASHAGEIVRNILKMGDLQIVEKENAADLQTEADRAAQRYILSSLVTQFPGLTVIGEEDEVGESSDALTSGMANLEFTCPPHLANLTEEQVVVWVDPLDGTAEYTQGLLDHVTVLIGIATSGKAVAGVIHQPYFNYKDKDKDAVLGRTIWGVVGANNSLGVVEGLTVQPPSAHGAVVTTTRSHSSKLVLDAVTACEPTEVLRVGGAGHKVLLLLEGRAHAYVFASPGCKKWDTCAPEAILHAAGGKLTDITGKDLHYHSTAQHRNSSGVLATAPTVSHGDYLSKIPTFVKESLSS